MVKKIALLAMVSSLALATTYKIAEPDMLTEIDSRKDIAIKNAKKQLSDAEKRVAKIKGEPLLKATKSFSYFVDPTYTLSVDIPKVDRNGKQIGILYPKGYTFNPLDFVRIVPPPMIVFDACNKKETGMAKELTQRIPNAMFVSSGCELEDFPKDVDRQIYIVTKEMKEKFKLTHTLSLVSVDLNAKRIKVEVFKTNN